MTDTSDFYAAPGLLTDLGTVPALALRELPADPVELCAIAGRTIVHEALVGALGWNPPEARRAEIELRAAADIVRAALTQQRSPLVDSRGIPRRVLGTCRDFSVLSVALLRCQGIPARARCGFATYFEDRCVDHWIVEVSENDGWRRIDPELLGPETQALLAPSVDATLLPDGAFLTGADAWRRCRAGEDDPERFGIYDEWGLDFVRGNLVKDLASLNKVEMLPWDGWGAALAPLDDDAGLEFLDGVADAIKRNDAVAIRSLYRDQRLRTPPIVTAFGPGLGAQQEVPELSRVSGTVIVESLTRADVLDRVTVTGSKRCRVGEPASDRRSDGEAVSFEAPGRDAQAIAELLASALRPGAWYADFHDHNQRWVVFAGRCFHIPLGDDDARAAALEHARRLGVQALQVDSVRELPYR